MKTCSNKKCTQNNPQPLDSFCKDSGTKDGLYPRCKSCKREYEKNRYHLKHYQENKRLYREMNKDKLVEYERKRQLKKYGITLEYYNEMLKIQNYRCFICGAHQDSLNRKLSVDHCHETGLVRSLLCDCCNQAIGLFKENVDVMKHAIEYINFHKEKKNVAS